MKSWHLCGWLLSAFIAQGAVILSNIVPAPVYVVTRAASTEARALLSARLVAMRASNLFWYEGTGVVRAEIPAAALDTLRADHDVVLVMPQDQPPQPQQQTMPPAMLQQTPIMPGAGPGVGSGIGMTGGMGMGMGAGMGMGMSGMGMLDNLAGSMVNRFMNRTPGCKISMLRTPAKFEATGGEGSVLVSASGTCAWQAQSSADWIQINSGSGVSGTGLISYTILPGAKKSRSAVIILTPAAGGAPLHGNASHIVFQAGN